MIRKIIAGARAWRGMINARTVFILALLSITYVYRPVAASEPTPVKPTFSHHVYVATGLGLSHLDPDTSEVATDVNDRVNAAGQITLGIDINKWLSLEAHSADLGSAGLTPQGRINYHVHGSSGLFYVGRNRGKHVRQGFSAFGRLGLGYLHNSPVGNVRYKRENPVHLLFGAGVEFTSSYGLGGRLELFSFDNDALYTQLALLFRFGGRHQDAPVLLAAEEIEPMVTPAAVVAPVPAIAVANPDKDADGVLNEDDECPATQATVSVNAHGCALFNGVADGVNFYTDSARLTTSAKNTLDSIVALLTTHNSVHATIGAHTDNIGDANYNQALSKRRAQSVVDYLSQSGIRADRLDAKAFGESVPISSNDTAEGRQRNRRVEIVVHGESE